MNRRIQTLGALAGVLFTLTCSAHAKAAPQGLRMLAATSGRSDSNLRRARQRVEQNISLLQQDRSDYDGHRAKAIALFQDAREQLTLGLAYDGGREDVALPAVFSRPDAGVVEGRGDRGSDANIVAVRQNIEGIIDVLQRDNHDYGGHRMNSLRSLQAGRDQLNAALAADSRR